VAKARLFDRIRNSAKIMANQTVSTALRKDEVLLFCKDRKGEINVCSRKID
jgi:hypothetical protein